MSHVCISMNRFLALYAPLTYSNLFRFSISCKKYQDKYLARQTLERWLAAIGSSQFCRPHTCSNSVPFSSQNKDEKVHFSWLFVLPTAGWVDLLLQGYAILSESAMVITLVDCWLKRVRLRYLHFIKYIIYVIIFAVLDALSILKIGNVSNFSLSRTKKE